MQSPLPPGTVLGGAYRIEKQIGAGGMGAVYEASHIRLPRRFAIKVLSSAAAQSGDAVARFQREAQVASALGSTHIASVLDFNRTESGEPYMVLELLAGEDLGARLAKAGRLSLADTVSIVEQSASALELAHANQIVHRDLKPANLFLCSDRARSIAVKVLDFGISKILASEEATTVAGAIFGTPHYMAPEQATGKQTQIDARTDQFALGAIAYECLAGKRAFDADSAVSALYLVCHSEPPPLDALGIGISRKVAAVIERAMKKTSVERYATVREFAEALANAAISDTLAKSPNRTVREKKRTARRRLLGVGVVAALAGGGLMVERSMVDRSMVDGTTVDRSMVDRSTVDGSTIDRSMVDKSMVDGSIVDGSTIVLATVQIAVTPWAEVTIDGKSYGTTPITADLPAGAHRIVLQNRERKRSEIIEQTLRAGQRVKLRRTW